MRNLSSQYGAPKSAPHAAPWTTPHRGLLRDVVLDRPLDELGAVTGEDPPGMDLANPVDNMALIITGHAYGRLHQRHPRPRPVSRHSAPPRTNAAGQP